jgi:hypothetical protein
VSKEEVDKISDELRESIRDYMKSDGPGGKQIIASFMEEFEKLSERSPQDDPTNIKNHMDFVVSHIKQTWDESLKVTEDGNIEVGICTDETLGFKEDNMKLKHNPSPILWAVYLIRGIGGQYAFVNPETYFKKKGEPMPPVYYGGFLISKGAWEREGWNVVGPFSKYKHPASGATPIPFGKNAMDRVDIESIVGEAIANYKAERGL